MKIREEIYRFLAEELVGPSPGLPAVQLNGEEILPPDAPPRLRYGAGILFPGRSALNEQEDDEAAEESPQEDGENSIAGSIGEKLTGETDPHADERGDSQSETDFEVNRTNEFLPSALGITALVEVPDRLEVEVRAAQYRPEELPGEGYTNRDGEWVASKFWFRVPLDQTIEIDGQALLQGDSIVIEKPLKTANQGTGFALHVFSRKPGPEIPSLGDRVRFVTITLINRTERGSRISDQDCLFQCGVRICDPSGAPCFREYPERVVDGDETEEELALALLYRHRRVYAVGHGCAADWDGNEGGRATATRSEILPAYDMPPILPTEMEGLNLEMKLLADEDSSSGLENCDQLISLYRRWIRSIETELEEQDDMPAYLQEAGKNNIGKCSQALERMSRGLSILRENETAAEAFALMNRAMVMQHAHYEIATEKKRRWSSSAAGLQLESSFEPPDYSASTRSWRPFQLAFVLMTLGSIVLDEERDHEERSIVDLIWFPTGGGKTEAYLGLAAFTVFYRRLTRPEDCGTTTLMRYTLRLLTTQQFQRAASLICACEVIRQSDRERLGECPISIGLWVGGSVTPNSEQVAVSALGALTRGERENPFIVLCCPWCGAQMGPVRHGAATRVKGYRKFTNPNRVRLVCEDPDCALSHGKGLPLQVIDEHIYRDPPTLLIGTVDKFALLPWYPAARSLFGIGMDGINPPDLVIQDELHLISGPLGSMVGHYELLIDGLCRRREGERDIPVKIVASTATISRANEQIEALYGGRTACLFPPQGLRAGDSFFAEERPELEGRKYVGVFATGLPSLTSTEVRVLGCLLQAARSAVVEEEQERDPYWTCMVYFNSIRELGHAATLLRADIPEYMNVLWRRFGYEKRWSEVAAARRRFINSDLELTSRVQNSEITDYMERLFTSYPKQGDGVPVDVCLATNMIQVGLDVPRLSLMAIVGQPKTTSEYIQASSRVGRSQSGPGLVVTMLSPAKPRDRSHFEHFRTYHQSIYRYVEPTSVTPFSVPVAERALHALVVTLARFWGGTFMQHPDPPSAEIESRIRREILGRVSSVDPAESARIERSLDRIFQEWARLPPDIWGSFTADPEAVPFIYPSGTHASEHWDSRAYATPSSMRNVDANCQAAMISVYPDVPGGEA